MKTVAFTSTARKSLRRLPPEIADMLKAKIERYAETGAGDVRALSGVALARLRSGDYRIIFSETAMAVEVLELGHRREIYR